MAFTKVEISYYHQYKPFHHRQQQASSKEDLPYKPAIENIYEFLLTTRS